jgi:hypothetical protein
MNWYEIKSGKHPKKFIPPADSTYGATSLECATEDCDLVYSAQVGQPGLVNASVFHNVSTVLSKRHCYSFVLIKKGTNPLYPSSRVTWEDAVKIFKDYIVEVK